MSIDGKYVKTFKEANLASCTGISLDADYKHYFFDVIEVKEKEVKLKSHNRGEEFNFKIHNNKHGEYAEIEQKSTFEIMCNRKPTKFKIAPFKGERH